MSDGNKPNISKLALGTVQFGLDYGISNQTGRVPIDEVNKILDIAQQHNIRYIDTAYAYGESERVLGNFDLGNFSIVTKFIHVNSKQFLLSQFEDSLARMNLTSVFGYLAHRPLEIYSNPKIWDDLEKLKSKSLIQKIGFSFNSIEEVEKIKKTGIIPDLIQVPYNYLDHRYESIIMEWKGKYNTEIHTRSTYLQGLLLMHPNKLSSFFNAVKPVLKNIQGKNLIGQLLQYVLNKAYIDKVVVGVTNAQQFIENIEICNRVISPISENKIRVSDEILTPSKWVK